MPARGASLYFSDDPVSDAQNKIEFWVKKPASNNSPEIRDAVLIEHFGYTADDIIELDKQKPGYFYVSDTRDTKNWATYDDVGSWKTNAGGEVPITLTRNMIQFLKDFRRQRVTASLYKAVAAISDSELRGKVLEYLQKLFSQSESERITGLSGLLTEASGSLGKAYDISTAAEYLTDKAGYYDNPLLILIRANAAITEYRMKSGPGYDIDARTLLNEAIRKTGANFIFGSDRSPLSLSRREAAFVNRQAVSLYTQLGNNKEARERDWATRFYEMEDDERADLNEGDMIELISPVTAMSKPQALTDAQSKLQKLNKDQAQTTKTWSDIDKIGSQMVPTDHRAGELYQSPNDNYELRKLRQEKGRFQQSGKSLRYKVVMLNQNPYSKANVYADGYGAVFELPLKLAKGINTLRRLNEITNYLNKRDNLLRQIKNENRYVVPPKPQDVEVLVKQVQRFGRITANPYEKNRGLMTLRDLERLWEESNAFWKTRK